MTILADTVDVVIGVDPHKHTHTAAVIAATVKTWIATRGTRIRRRIDERMTGRAVSKG